MKNTNSEIEVTKLINNDDNQGVKDYIDVNNIKTYYQSIMKPDRTVIAFNDGQQKILVKEHQSEITDLVTKKKQEIANIIIGQPRIIFIETITRNAAGFKVKHLININEISNITESSDSEMAIITYKDGSQYIAYEQYIEIKKRIARSFDY